MGKHKQVLCKVCYKEMRSDHLNRHMKVHETNDGSKMMRGQTTIDEKALEIAALNTRLSCFNVKTNCFVLKI